MDSTFFLFFEIAAFLIFFYSLEAGEWRGLLVFLAMALFLALSIASYDISKTMYFFNESSGEIVQHTGSTYDISISLINEGMALLSLSIGVIKSLIYRETYNSSNSD